MKPVEPGLIVATFGKWAKIMKHRKILSTAEYHLQIQGDFPAVFFYHGGQFKLSQLQKPVETQPALPRLVLP